MTGHERDDTGAAGRGAIGDAAIERAWRDASDDQPPSAVDAIVLAAAHAAASHTASVRPAVATERARSSGAFGRWQPFAVAASVAGLAFVLVQLLPRSPDVASPGSAQRQTYSDTAATGVEPPTPGPTVLTAEKALPSAAGGAVEDAGKTRATDSAVPAPVLEAESAANAVAPEAAHANVAERAPAHESGTATPLPAAPAAVSTQIATQAKSAAPVASATRERADAAERPDPDAWAARIAAMHAAGELEDAAMSLRNFRATYEHADDYLPAGLRDWARTVE